MIRAQILRPLAALVPDPGPRRIYGLATLVNTVGFGLIITSSVLYFTRVVHLSTHQVGLGLTVAGLVGLVASVPIGDLADRHDPRQVVRVTMLVEGLATFGYLIIHNFVGFLVVATVDMLGMNASQSAGGALLWRVGGDDATTFRSTERAISNVGISLGAVGCAAAVQLGTPDAYRALIIGNGLSFLAAFLIAGKLPRYEPLPRPADGPRWAALTDKPFVAYVVLNAAMSLQYFVLILLLPLWVVDHTGAPRWSVGLYLLINTVMVVLLQVRVGKNVQSIRQGGSALRRAGLLFLVSCTAIGLAASLPGWAALIVLTAAVGWHTVGEMSHASASFALDFGMAPAHAQGQYQGLAGLGMGAGAAAAPVALIGLALSFGVSGWVGLGAWFAGLGLAAPALARWGERTRPRPTETATPAQPASAGSVLAGENLVGNAPPGSQGSFH
jgi:predicted MFS family arabinose efflux permease